MFLFVFVLRIFQEHKEIKGKWIFATNLETEAEMLSNSQVRYHAKKILGVISKIVEKLTSTPDVRQFDLDEFGLVKLGRSHYHYNVRREHFVVSFCLSLSHFILLINRIIIIIIIIEYKISEQLYMIN